MLVEMLVETSESSNKKTSKKLMKISTCQLELPSREKKKTRSGEMLCSMKVICLDLLDGRPSHEGVIL